MKIRVKDLQLALEHITQNSLAEYVTIDANEISGVAMSLEFTDKNSKLAKVFLYDTASNTTPELRTTQKLYRKT